MQATDRQAGWFITLRDVGVFVLGAGIVLATEFIMSIPELIQVGRDAAQNGNLSLVMMGAVYRCIPAVTMMTVGTLLVLYHRSRR